MQNDYRSIKKLFSNETWILTDWERQQRPKVKHSIYSLYNYRKYSYAHSLYSFPWLISDYDPSLGKQTIRNLISCELNTTIYYFIENGIQRYISLLFSKKSKTNTITKHLYSYEGWSSPHRLNTRRLKLFCTLPIHLISDISKGIKLELNYCYIMDIELHLCWQNIELHYADTKRPRCTVVLQY